MLSPKSPCTYKAVLIIILLLRDLARTCPAYLLGRQFPENLFFDRQKLLLRIFHSEFLGVVTKHFPAKSLFRTWLKCKLSFLTTAIKCSWSQDMK